MKISKILSDAADYHLSDGIELIFTSNWVGRQRFSCFSIDDSICHNLPKSSAEEKNDMFDRIIIGLRKMGMGNHAFSAFKKLEGKYLSTKEAQEARYFWLKWASHMAEEQGD